MIRVLYLAAGNPIKPVSGMDLACYAHLHELAESRDLSVHAIAVAPGISGQSSIEVSLSNTCQVELFVGDLLIESVSLNQRINKLKMLWQRAVPVMAYPFKSSKAAQRIQEVLKNHRFDIVVIDHFYALANVNLRAIQRSGAKLIYVSHNQMRSHISEMALFKARFFERFYFRLESARAHFAERKLFQVAAKVVHLSEYERKCITKDIEKHLALLPPIPSGRQGLMRPSERSAVFRDSVLFIGSTAHPPNAHAIDWMVQKLAPALAKLDPTRQILLVGGGTEHIACQHGNLRGLGFINAEQLQWALQDCALAISPVKLGRGIKVKVLDAIAAGSPLLATKESLRGFEHFNLRPDLDLNSPDQVAQRITDLVSRPGELKAARRQMEDCWREFEAQRKGALARLVKSV